MSNRSRNETPAIVIAAVLGLVLIGASAPFVAALVPNDHTYAVGWVPVEGAKKSQAFAAAGTPATAQVDVAGQLTSSVTVTAKPCNDTPSPVETTATIHWVLERRAGANVTKLGEEDFSCAQAASYVKTFTIQDAPQIGERTVAGKEKEPLKSVSAEVYHVAGKLNETASYVLTFSWTRPSGSPLPGLPGGVGATAVTGEMQVTASHYLASFTEKLASQEVVK